jgi:excisionase family DNA binding protein
MAGTIEARAGRRLTETPEGDADGAGEEHCAAASNGGRRQGLERHKAYLTVDEVADQYLRTSKKAVYAMIARGQLPGVVRFMRRRVLVRRADLTRWLDSGRISKES